VYLYAANNPSEATLAKRRANAITITHLTPPLAQAGLYKGFVELKESLTRWRAMRPDDTGRVDLEKLIRDQANAVDLNARDLERLWLKVLETEGSLGDSDAAREAAALMAEDHELPAIMRALSGHFTAPVPGGDLIRSPEILPTGRNIHAFDPFRMPTTFAMADGAKQAKVLLDTHEALPRTVAMVLWGSDNIKSDGGPIGQALALMGAKPRFDNFGRLAGADLIPLETLGRPRIDVVMTLSGIFRDLLPLQTRMLAEAALKCAQADEPLAQNFVRAHALAYADEMGCELEQAALRVFSNAEGAYGANVNQLIDSSAFGDKRAKGGAAAPVYIGDQTRGSGKVRTLQDQVALETRARSLNPKFYEGLLKHGHEGVRQIEAHITNTVGWSATTGEVEPWVYQRLSETFVLDAQMRERLAALNPQASMRMANRLLEASDRAYWAPDADTLEALQEAADQLEDHMEGVAAE